jgi:hypothetical protein
LRKVALVRRSFCWCTVPFVIPAQSGNPGEAARR